MRSKPGRLWLLVASLLGMAAEAASPLGSFRSLLPSDCCFAPSAKQQLTLAVRAWHAGEYRLALCCAGEVIRASSPGHTGSAGDVPPASLESIPCIRPAHRNCTRCFSETAPWVVAAASLERLGESAKASSIYAAVDSALGAYQGARGWEYVGPFITGKSELDGDPLEVREGPGCHVRPSELYLTSPVAVSGLWRLRLALRERQPHGPLPLGAGERRLRRVVDPRGVCCTAIHKCITSFSFH